MRHSAQLNYIKSTEVNFKNFALHRRIRKQEEGKYLLRIFSMRMR